MSYLTASTALGKFFLPIPGHAHYEISLAGEVRNRRTQHVLRAFRGTISSPYLRCGLGDIHRLLMAAVIGRELTRDEQVRHLDGDSYNNAIGNLRLGTARDNRHDRLLTDNYGSKLRIQDIRDIRACIGQLSPEQLAARHGVTSQQIRRIIRGDCWAALQ